VLFGIYLVLVAWLAFRSGYVPKWVAGALGVCGLGWVVTKAVPFFALNANVDFLFFTSFGALVLVLWLLIWGWRLKEPESVSP
jgi:hypothetical protein